jgi:integrase
MKKGSKYDILLEDKNIKRWFDNKKRRSIITAEVYLNKLGFFCNMNGITPQELVKLSKKEIYNLVLDTITEKESKGNKGGYIKCIVKAVKSWCKFNDKPIENEIIINGVNTTPTLANEVTPTQDDLKKIVLAGDLRAKAVCMLLSQSGLRPQVLGNFKGTDGLRVRDFPELKIAGKQVEFEKVPTKIVVRAELCKKRKEYFTFLSDEGCAILKEYLELRLETGELKSDSSILPPKSCKGKEFIRTTNICDTARKTIRNAGFRWRPYIFRRYFATQVMVAEAKGHIIHDYRVFFMGHAGNMSATYTVNKRLAPEVEEGMRECYKKCQAYLQTAERTRPEDDIKNMFKKELLTICGFNEEEIQDCFEMEQEDFQDLIRQKLLNTSNEENEQSNTPKQRLVEMTEIDNYLSIGWEYVQLLPNNKIIMKMNDLLKPQ